jgi:hypothetical protein
VCVCMCVSNAGVCMYAWKGMLCGQAKDPTMPREPIVSQFNDSRLFLESNNSKSVCCVSLFLIFVLYVYLYLSLAAEIYMLAFMQGVLYTIIRVHGRISALV